jgi:hypothetical protein
MVGKKGRAAWLLQACRSSSNACPDKLPGTAQSPTNCCRIR